MSITQEIIANEGKGENAFAFANSMFVVVNKSPSYAVTLQSDSNVEQT
jgi:hypothetical protein